MSSSRRPHGGGHLPGQGQDEGGQSSPVSPISRPHGGEHLPGQVRESSGRIGSPIPDLTELHHDISQHEMPTAYHMQELPAQETFRQQVASPIPSSQQWAGQESYVQQSASHQVPIQTGSPQPWPDQQYVQPVVPQQYQVSDDIQIRSGGVSQNSYIPAEKQPEATYQEKGGVFAQTYETTPSVAQWDTPATKSVDDDQENDAMIVIEYPPTYSNYLNTPSNPILRKPQAGTRNIFSADTKYRWLKTPHHYKSPNIKPPTQTKHRHRDSMGRVYFRPAAERFLSPWDGKLNKLLVQTVDEIYNDNTQAHTWRRTYVRKIGPLMLRAAYWPLKTVPITSGSYSSQDKLTIALRWLPACLALFVTLPIPRSGAVALDGGQYFPFPYKYWGSCKVARNPKEDVKTNRALHWNASTDDRRSERLLRPRYLMFLNDSRSEKIHDVTCMSDEEWNNKQPNESTKKLPYVFISYTAEQFQDAADWDILHEIGQKAARRAGVSAYWVGCSCMPGSKKELEEDVYRLSDVIRGAYSLVIAVGNKKGYQADDRDTTGLLLEWGSRMWTFPEALLSPNDKFVEIYTRGLDYNQPLQLTKKELPTWVWADADKSQEMMDHFSGALTLSRLELVDLAMKYLLARETEGYFAGDMAYALMGLLRRRPMVDNSDSQFQALARLSLANDNDLLLERLVCMSPKIFNEKWLQQTDAWDISLWDIMPNCQVAGIGNKDTVILDGCRAASIKWDQFEPVDTARKSSWGRFYAQMLVRLSPILLILGIIFRANPVGIILILVGLITWLASPYLVKVVYSGKIWDQQAWLFGFEGYCDIATIEYLIFGYNMKRLAWSPCGSPLSRHSINISGEWIGRDPTDDAEIARKVEAAKTAQMGQMRIFTIVDTFTMTVFLVEAVRPPVCVLLTGSEGGMQRGVLCSYEWRGQTLYKEAVLRMETHTLERMPRIGRVNFGFWRGAGVGFE